ncbi:MAG: hypothetical protein NVV74_17360 [Magnetospirillum sp.]|nr:hypothetical protein [Magnetospirillum sp.]
MAAPERRCRLEPVLVAGWSVRAARQIGDEARAVGCCGLAELLGHVGAGKAEQRDVQRPARTQRRDGLHARHHGVGIVQPAGHEQTAGMAVDGQVHVGAQRAALDEDRPARQWRQHLHVLQHGRRHGTVGRGQAGGHVFAQMRRHVAAFQPLQQAQAGRRAAHHAAGHAAVAADQHHAGAVGGAVQHQVHGDLPGLGAGRVKQRHRALRPHRLAVDDQHACHLAGGGGQGSFGQHQAGHGLHGGDQGGRLGEDFSQQRQGDGAEALLLPAGEGGAAELQQRADQLGLGGRGQPGGQGGCVEMVDGGGGEVGGALGQRQRAPAQGCRPAERHHGAAAAPGGGQHQAGMGARQDLAVHTRRDGDRTRQNGIVPDGEHGFADQGMEAGDNDVQSRIRHAERPRWWLRKWGGAGPCASRRLLLPP